MSRPPAARRPGLSLGMKIPLAMGALIAGTLLVATGVERVQLERTLVESEGRRMAAVLELLSGAVRQVTLPRIGPLRAVGRATPVRALLSGSADAATEVDRVLTAHLMAQSNAISVSLLDAHGTCVADARRDGEGGSRGTGFGSCRSTYPAPDPSLLEKRGFGPLRQRAGALYSELLVAVGDSDAPAGYLLERREGASREVMAVVADLISSDAVILLGNLDGSLWTDFRDVVEGPAVGSTTGGPTQYRRNGGGRLVGMGVAVAGTPWTLWLERNRAAVVAPAADFLVRSGLVLLALLAVALPLAWTLSRRFTTPLVELTAAAETFAAGHAEPRVRVDRVDELGRLGDAFNAMAEEVSAAREALEARVEERTTELRAALEDLGAAQERLVRKERLAALGALAGGVAHELRNPLGVLQNALALLERGVATDSAETAEYMEMCREQVRVSERIIGDLLDLARIQAAARVPTSVGPILREQAERVRAARDVDVDVDLPPELPPSHVDPLHIGQIVGNLLANAADAIGTGSDPISVVVRVVTGGIVVSVRDRGPGVAPDVADRLFEPLVTTKSSGIGLGLYISRELASVNGCTLELVRTPPGQGAVFELSIPDGDQASADAEARGGVAE